MAPFLVRSVFEVYAGGRIRLRIKCMKNADSAHGICFSLLFWHRLFVAVPLVLLLLIFTLFQGGGRFVQADSSLGNVAAGSTPFAIAVNPVTNKIYTANQGSNTVTVIDGTNNATATVTVAL